MSGRYVKKPGYEVPLGLFVFVFVFLYNTYTNTIAVKGVSVIYVKKSGYEVPLGLDRLPQFKLLHHNFQIGRLLIQANEKWNVILLSTTF